MLYYANPTTETDQLMTAGVIGWADSPISAQRQRLPGVLWSADNGCFSDRFNEARWWAWLERNAADASMCAFAAAPDVVGDAAATLERSQPWLPKIRALGYPAAFVAQDGQERVAVPWDGFDVLFIGGTDTFKLGSYARQLVAEAKQRGLRVHMGRVNSLRRYRYAEAIGCNSVDGTFLTYGPKKNLPRLLRWPADLKERPALFRMTGEPA